MPGSCYEAGHYQASMGRFVLGMTLAMMLAVLAAIGFVKRRGGYFKSRPWFER